MKKLLLLALALLSACGPSVKRADYAPSPDIPETAHPRPVKWSGLELILPPGTNIGTDRSGVFCQVPGTPVNRNTLNKAVDEKYTKQTFHDALEANGYDVVGSIDIAFDEDDEEQRAEYAVKARLADAQLDMCSSKEGSLYAFTSAPGERGELYAAIDWSVYDYLKRTVVYKTRTEGYSKRDLPNEEGLALMLLDAFEMAAHNLAADESFRALLVEGVQPEKKPDLDPLASAARTYDPAEEVAIDSLPLSLQPFSKTAEQGRKAAVTVHKIRHGGGLFITRQGHILTTYDTVGDAARVRIYPAGPRRSLTAEVLRVDKARNVALLKLIEIPEKFEIALLPLRLDWPGVGSDVYVIGAPQDWKQLRNTLTKGIVSAHRKNMLRDGLRQNYIQADVEMHPGSYGGPVLDEHGNVVGLAVMGWQGDTPGMGLNYFIPISEALDRLDIQY